MLLTFFISLTLYARQQFIFLALFHILLLILRRNKKDLFFTLIFYLILSMPGFYVLFIWGVFNDISQANTQSGNLDIKNIFLSIPKISSLFFFYSIPLILINFSKFFKIFLSKKNLMIFVIIFIIKFFLYHDIEYSIKSGGYVVKFTQFFLNNDPSLLILISSAFFAFIISVINLDNYKYFLILPFIYLNYGFVWSIYQEWFDPLYLFIYYIFFSRDHISNLKLNTSNTIKILFAWEFVVLVIALIYYHGFKNIPFFYSF